MVEYLPNVYEVLGSIFSHEEKRKEKEKKREGGRRKREKIQGENEKHKIFRNTENQQRELASPVGLVYLPLSTHLLLGKLRWPWQS